MNCKSSVRTTDIVASADLKYEYHIAKIGVFGSVIRGEAKEKSDIDIVYVMEEEYTLGFRAKIIVERKLKKALGFKKIDFINSRCLNPIIELSIQNK
jgi:predicted nucleotidyltransferase